MDYEKLYKESLERAREIYQGKYKPEVAVILAETLQSIFPEIVEPVESEDEKIRKDLINWVKTNISYERMPVGMNYSNECVLDWLEKQGESIDKEKVEIDARKDLALSIINYLDNNRVEGCMNLSSMECEDLENAIVNSDWGKVYRYMKKKLETPNVKVKCKEAVDYDKTWLKKTSRQESTDEPELRFKVGDWVVQKDGDTFYGGARTVQISKIEGDKIWFTSGTWLTSYYIRHWNIEDAKDGDILIYRDSIFIFNEVYNHCLIYYCIYEHNKFHNDKCYSFLDLDNMNMNYIHPSTKEDRDILFTKMKEAGYEWNVDKKALKKI